MKIIGKIETKDVLEYDNRLVFKAGKLPQERKKNIESDESKERRATRSSANLYFDYHYDDVVKIEVGETLRIKLDLTRYPKKLAKNYYWDVVNRVKINFPTRKFHINSSTDIYTIRRVI